MRERAKSIEAGWPLNPAGIGPVVITAFAAMATVLFVCAGAEGYAQTSVVRNEADDPKITGFRSAQFGMSQTETRDAIQRDFQLLAEDVEVRPDDGDRTSSLVIGVEEIFPGSDPAQVFYIHGYKQKKLMQVNVIWGLPVTEEPDPKSLVTTANVLRNYFRQLGFDPATTVVNTRVDDELFIVFRATDQKERMVLLQLISRRVPSDGESGAESDDVRSQVVSLWLSYIEDARSPDIFEIEEGAF